MPRNPDKTRCTVPGCRNWAMRGHDRCRVHRDAKLGPRGAGAPPGNLNALKHGQYAHPLPALDIEPLVETAVGQAQDLPFQVGLALHSIQTRTNDPFLALVAFYSLLSQLTDRVAANLFDRELDDLLSHVSAKTGNFFRTVFVRQISGVNPQERLLILRKIKNQLKQLPEREPGHEAERQKTP